MRFDCSLIIIHVDDNKDGAGLILVKIDTQHYQLPHDDNAPLMILAAISLQKNPFSQHHHLLACSKDAVIRGPKFYYKPKPAPDRGCLAHSRMSEQRRRTVQYHFQFIPSLHRMALQKSARQNASKLSNKCIAPP